MLVYPNSYHVGMSNLGFQTVYKILNEINDISCERAFLETGFKKPVSIESGRYAKDFDAIIFSVSFEIDFLNVIRFLQCSGIPLSRKERVTMPPLIAGGIAVTLNFKPLLDIMDYFLIGDGEELVAEFLISLFEGKQLSNIRGVIESKKNNSTLPAIYKGNKICHSVISTNNTEFSETLLLEIARGCPYKCNFCAVSYNYAPYRIHKLEDIKKTIEDNIKIFKKIGIVGASVTSHPDFLPLCKWLNRKKIPFSVTSLRLNTVNEEIVEELLKGKNNSFAVAVEACSDNLRKIINKGLTDKEIFRAIDIFIKKKVINLKVYIIVGLPFEQFEDVTKIVDFVVKIKEMYMSKRKLLKNFGNLSISVNPFIPKPNTPFHKYKMESEESLRKKIKFLHEKLKKIPNVRIFSEDIYRAYLQGLLSKADSQIMNYLVEKINSKISDKRFFKNNAELFKKYNVI